MATVPAWAKPIVEAQEDHDKRIKSLETIYSDIAEIKTSVSKTAQWIKRGIPTLITAAIAAGLVNGQLAAFLKALVS